MTSHDEPLTDSQRRVVEEIRRIAGALGQDTLSQREFARLEAAGSIAVGSNTGTADRELGSLASW